MTLMTAARAGWVAILSATILACATGNDGSQAPPRTDGDAAADAPVRNTSPDAGSSIGHEGGQASDSPSVDGNIGNDTANDIAVGDGGAGRPDERSDAPNIEHTSAGVPVPAGWTLKRRDRFGTGAGSTVTSFAQLHARYYEGMYYNRDADGLVKLPNVVINSEQQTYSHFETVIAWSTDHVTIQARGRADGSITSGELVSVYTTRSFCTEARYRIPSQAGSWPAFWFYEATTGGDKSEIDVEQPITPNQGVTAVSLYNHPSQSNVVIADPAFTTKWMTWTKASFDASASPHTYTACYDDASSSIARYIDGALIYTATFKWNASLGGTGHGPDVATIVNLAVGGGWPGDVANPSAFAADLDLYSIESYGP
jgi:hypothetical protein